MRIQIRLKAYFDSFPLDYRLRLMNFIINLINSRNLDLRDRFNRCNFTFSVYFKDMKIKNNKIYVKKYSDVYLNISVPNDIGTDILVVLESVKICEIFEDGFYFQDYKHQLIPETQKNEVYIKLMSPLMIKSGNQYLCVEDENFVEKASEILSQLHQSKIKLIPVKASKTVVKTNEDRNNVSIGHFLLIASNNVINKLSQEGVGFNRREGFGMFQFIEHNKNQAK